MKKTHIFSGHGQLPVGSDIYENHKYATIVAEVDIDSGVIVNCAIPTYCEQIDAFAGEILKGRCLDSDMERMIADIDTRMHVLSKKALITALQMVYNRYTAVKQTRA